MGEPGKNYDPWGNGSLPGNIFFTLGLGYYLYSLKGNRERMNEKEDFESNRGQGPRGRGKFRPLSNEIFSMQLQCARRPKKVTLHLTLLSL